MSEERKFQIFRDADARDLGESGMMEMVPFTPDEAVGFEKMIDAGLLDGGTVRVLVNIPGFSIVHVWFKKDYPLPLHSHSSDCTYYIVSGGLKLGKETLGPRDCFFIPGDAPYTYTVGPDGVELLEIRTVGQFDFKNFAKSSAFFERATETISANRESWKNAKLPSMAS